MTPVPYRLERRKTAVSTGYFAPIPHVERSPADHLEDLRAYPTDAFMHTPVLGRIGTRDADAAADPAICALPYQHDAAPSSAWTGKHRPGRKRA